MPTCDVLWNSEINTTCSLPARNLALLLLIEDYGEKQKKKEEEKLVQSPFPFSLYSDENLMLFYPSIHYCHGSQIAIMLNGLQSQSKWHGDRTEFGRWRLYLTCTPPCTPALLQWNFYIVMSLTYTKYAIWFSVQIKLIFEIKKKIMGGRGIYHKDPAKEVMWERWLYFVLLP